MTRRTSVEAYNEIKSKGLLSAVRMEVYEALYKHGPLTGGELWSRHLKHHDRVSISPAFAPMVRSGAIYEVTERKCGYSGMTCIVYDVTGDVPVQLQKQETKNQTITRLCNRILELENQIKKSQNCMFCGPNNASH